MDTADIKKTLNWDSNVRRIADKLRPIVERNEREDNEERTRVLERELHTT